MSTNLSDLHKKVVSDLEPAASMENGPQAIESFTELLKATEKAIENEQRRIRAEREET